MTWSIIAFAFTVLPATPPVQPPALDPAGSWALVGNGFPGDLLIRLGKDGKIEGTMYDQPMTGTYDSASKRVVLNRTGKTKSGGLSPVQVYTGNFTAVPDSKPTRYRLEGTFKTADEPGWGQPSFEYPWKAERKEPAAPLSARAQELKEIQGRYEVTGSQATSTSRHRLPEEIGLDQPGARITIRGNQWLVNDKVVATLANDLYVPDHELEGSFHTGRRPLLVVLPDGRAFLVGYKYRFGGIDLVYPHTIGQVGVGQFVSLKRLPDLLRCRCVAK